MTDETPATTRYTTHDVPVGDGTLRVAVWDADPGAPTLLAIHGITASHLAWLDLADALPDVRIVAPDLRGRGGSRDLGAPYGMDRHADDLATALAALDITPDAAVGHSMGGYVTAVLHHRHPQACGRPVLVDGGLPLPPPPGMTPDEAMTATLGPAKQRLSMTFPDADSYRQLWRQHPALASDWSAHIERYVAYDLVETPGGLRAAATYESMAGDTEELATGSSLLPALDALPGRTPWLLAPRGLLDQVPPLYDDAARETWLARYPQLSASEVPGVNHYTIVMSPRGAAAIAATLRPLLGLRND